MKYMIYLTMILLSSDVNARNMIENRIEIIEDRITKENEEIRNLKELDKNYVKEWRENYQKSLDKIEQDNIPIYLGDLTFEYKELRRNNHEIKEVVNSWTDGYFKYSYNIDMEACEPAVCSEDSVYTHYIFDSKPFLEIIEIFSRPGNFVDSLNIPLVNIDERNKKLKLKYKTVKIKDIRRRNNNSQIFISYDYGRIDLYKNQIIISDYKEISSGEFRIYFNDEKAILMRTVSK